MTESAGGRRAAADEETPGCTAVIAGDLGRDAGRRLLRELEADGGWDAVHALYSGSLEPSSLVTRLNVDPGDSKAVTQKLRSVPNLTHVLFLGRASGSAADRDLAADLEGFRSLVAAARAAGCPLQTTQFMTAEDSAKGRMHAAVGRQGSSSKPVFHEGSVWSSYRLRGVLSEAWSRGRWLLGLLILQSISSVVLDSYQHLIREHLVVTFFLTMLVGAGGNAGNQSAIKVIRGLATGKIQSTQNAMRQVAMTQLIIALILGAGLSVGGFFRVFVTHGNLRDSVAIAASLLLIVLASVLLGTALPFALVRAGIDPAHAGSSIQVLMDVLGVAITCVVCNVVLHPAVRASHQHGVTAALLPSAILFNATTA